MNIKKYALVENNVVTETHEVLPHCWRNISGLDLSRDNIEFLNSVGWYETEANTQFTYDSSTNFITDYTYEFANNRVVATPVVDIIPQQVITKEQFMLNLRIQRDSALDQSDWTQAADVIAMKSDEFNLAWKNYRQELRDITQQYENLESYDSVIIIFPSKPQI